MSSNLSTNTGYGNVYLTGNLVVQGNIYSIGGSVGSGSGTSQGVLYSLASPYSLGSAFATGTAGPGLSGYHVNMASFQAEAVASVSAFTASSGMLKFATGGLYQVTCVIVGDQPVSKIAIGKTSSSSFPPSVTATVGYDYVYNYPFGSSPSQIVTIPLTVQDTSQYYYLDVFFSTAGGTPTVLYPTRSTTAAGATFGTYVQVGPFGNYLTSATGVASGLLMNCYGTTTLSSPVTSNTFRLAMTTANGWTVNGVSTSLAVTSGGNIQVNQAGIYEVSLCLNPSATPMMFGIGSLSTDGAPSTQGPYLYQYAPMYTQDPTTVVSLPVNITDTSKYYYLDVIFPGSQATMALSNVSTFVSVKPVGSYVSPSTNPWGQQGSSVYYNSGPVGLGMNPSALTETLTVSGNTSFVGNVSVVSEAAGSSYVNARRVPTGSLGVASYVTGSVPLTTTTNLIQGYLSNTANVSTTGVGGYGPALGFAGTTSSWAQIPSQSAVTSTNAGSNIFVEAWVYISSTAGLTNPPIAISQGGGGDDWGLRFNTTSSKLEFFVYNTSTSFANVYTTNFSTGSWVYVAGAFTGANTTQFVYTFTASGSTSAAVAGNGTGTAFTAPARNQTVTPNLTIGGRANEYLNGYVYDLRIYKGGVIPRAGYTIAAATPYVFGTSQPAYITGTPTLHMSLQSQYFPGASTSPYGPCLTLPGTVGSYYTETGTFLNTPLNSGFTIEAWVNYASLANSNSFVNGPAPFMMGKTYPAAGATDWLFGAATTGQVSLYFFNGSTGYTINTAGTITTGSWNHIVAQANTTGYVNMYINGVQQTLQAGGYAGSGTAVALNGTVTTNQYNGITLGQLNNTQGPNFAIAKARVLFGANTYTVASFTPSPNLGPVPAGGTVAWSLESQFPLPSYPSIQDVTLNTLQSSSFGTVPVPVGGVTSNVIGPYISYPSFDSIRFDGTGYIDYGNAATSVMTTNIWASNWTIEGWAYFNNFSGASGTNVILGRNYQSGQVSYDWLFYVNNLGQLIWRYGNSVGVDTQVTGPTLSLSTWYHVAATYDGARTNVYCSINSSTVTSSAAVVGSMGYNPSYSTNAGFWNNSYITGNLADLRVSNVARYTGSSYTVPTAPFTTDANTLLLLKSLAGQTGTTLEVQGRGTQSVSLGATRSVQSYPPAPMSSYLLDTTGNAAVTYGQGKYVASSSSELASSFSWQAFNKLPQTPATPTEWTTNNGYASGVYTGSVTTVDALGIAYAGEWIQLQMPVSVILTTYSIQPSADAANSQSPVKWWILGSRDGLNWTLVDSRSGITVWTNSGTQSFTASATQAYNYFRLVANQGISTTLISIAEWTLNGTEESLCVTNDSKVGVGIANPQRALEVAGDVVVGGTLSAGNPLMFRNRIINGDMRIAQRGTSNVLPVIGATSGSVYLLDRWHTGVNITTGGVTQSQIALTSSDTPYQVGFANAFQLITTTGCSNFQWVQIRHRVEGFHVADLNWGTSFASPIVVSYWFKSNIPSGSLVSFSVRNSATSSVFNTQFQYGASSAWQYVVHTITPPPNGSSWVKDNSATGIEILIAPLAPPTLLQSNVNTWETVNNVGTTGAYNWTGIAGNYVQCTGVQLEKGTVATPFEVRPYATELALCQRYYQQFNSTPSTNNYTSFGAGYMSSATGAYTTLPLPVTMRTNPSLSSNSAPGTFIVGAPANLTVTSMSIYDSTPSTAGIAWVGTGATLGQGAIARANNTTGAFLGFSAEI